MPWIKSWLRLLNAATPPIEGSQLVLHGISWEIYEKLLEVFAEQPTPRMTYYKGTLEHETYSWTLGRLVVALSEEMGLEIRGLKSTTWRDRNSRQLVKKLMNVSISKTKQQSVAN